MISKVNLLTRIKPWSS